jgi:hypothetical protein
MKNKHRIERTKDKQKWAEQICDILVCVHYITTGGKYTLIRSTNTQKNKKERKTN